MKLTIRLFRNAVASYIGQFVTIITGLLLTPFVIRTLGETQYGIWTLAGSLLAYLILFDFGLANALAKYTGEYVARNDQDTVNRLSSTLLIIFTVVGVLAFGVAVWLSFNFTHFFVVPLGYYRSVRFVILLLGANFAVGLPLSIFNALTVGYQRYDILNAISSLGLILNAGLTVLVLLMGWDLIGLAAVTLLITILKPLFLWLAISRWVTQSFALRISLFDKGLSKALTSYSVFMFIIFACRQIESSSSSIIVGHFVSVEEVTVYAVGVKLSGFLANSLMPMTMIFFPAFSELSASPERSQLRELFVEGVRVTVSLGGPMTGFLIILSRPLISMWVGSEFADSAPVAIILILQTFLYQQLVIVGSLLQGIGRLRFFTILHVLVVTFGILFSVTFVREWGPLAVALGSLVSWTVAYLTALPYACRVTSASLGSLINNAIVRPLFAAATSCLVLYGLSTLYKPRDVLTVGLEVSASGLAYLPVYWLCCVSEQDRIAYLNAGRKILRHSLSGLQE